MLRIGAHMSVAGGVSKAVDRAAAHGCEALQIFTKNGNRWLGKALDPTDVRRFRARLEETLKSGDSVSFTGFGKFSAQQRAARMGVNPRTGEKVQIAAARVPTIARAGT